MAKELDIIIADDDAVTRGALRLLLIEQGHRVIGDAHDGEKLVELCSLHQPDVAFIDINMPKLNGLEAVERMRETCPKVGMIMITATPTLDNVQRALRAGISGFLVKPFNMVKVVETLNNYIKQR